MGDLNLDWLSDSSNTLKEQCLGLHPNLNNVDKCDVGGGTSHYNVTGNSCMSLTCRNSASMFFIHARTVWETVTGILGQFQAKSGKVSLR